MRETKTQKTTRIQMLLAEYDAKNREKNKLGGEVETLKKQISEIESGQYGDMILSRGNPKKIVDNDAIKQGYKDRGEQIPMRDSAPSIVVSHKDSK